MQGRSPPQDYGVVLEAPLKIMVSGEGREHLKTKMDNEMAVQHLTPQQEAAALEVESVKLACNLRRMDAPRCIAFLGQGRSRSLEGIDLGVMVGPIKRGPLNPKP